MPLSLEELLNGVNQFFESEDSRRRRIASEAREAGEMADLFAVMNTPEGRRVLARLIRLTGYGKQMPDDHYCGVANFGALILQIARQASETLALQILADALGFETGESK